MTLDQSTYGPFRDPSIPSLADALHRFDALPDETASRKARARGAVALYGRLVQKRSADIPAQPNVIMRQFARFKHRPRGRPGVKSLANCKSELRHLLEKVGASTGRSRFRPLSEEWAEIRDRFKDEPIERKAILAKLSRFMAFCSGLGITPEQVDKTVIEKFQEALIEADEVDRPERKVREVINGWNALTEALTGEKVGQPLARLSVPARRVPRWTIEPEKFPKEFQDDVDRFLARRSYVDPEAEEGPIRALRPESLKLYKHQIYAAASALVLTGRGIESIMSLSCLVEIDAFKALLKYLREERHDGKPTTALRSLASTLTSIARHEKQMPTKHLERMARICANYNVEERTTKTHDRLQAFDDERLLAALLHLPDKLLEEAADAKTSKRRTKVLAQVAAALEIEFQAPLREENLAELQIGQNIQPVVVHGETRWMVRFDRHETKNRSLLVYELPADTVRRVGRALRFFEQPDGFLFPGRRQGRHKDGNLLGKQIKQVVEQRLGVPFHLHMLRGLVATLQVKERQNGFEQARALLGDSSDRVIRKHYTSTAEGHLIRQAQDTIRKVRMRTAPVVAPRSKSKAA